MRRFYVRVAFVLTVLFMVCGTVLIAFGSTQPINPALRGFVEGCELPCWNGIKVGVTRTEEARRLLETYGYKIQVSLSQIIVLNASSISPEQCSASLQGHYQGVITFISLQNCGDAVLGDFISLFSDPNEIVICAGNLVVYPIIDYGTGIGLAIGSMNVGETISFFQNVRQVHLNMRRANEYRWHGFIPLWLYIDLEPSSVQELCP